MDIKIIRQDANEAIVEFTGSIWIARITEQEFKDELEALINKYAI